MRIHIPALLLFFASTVSAQSYKSTLAWTEDRIVKSLAGYDPCAASDWSNQQLRVILEQALQSLATVQAEVATSEGSRVPSFCPLPTDVCSCSTVQFILDDVKRHVKILSEETAQKADLSELARATNRLACEIKRVLRCLAFNIDKVPMADDHEVPYVCPVLPKPLRAWSPADGDDKVIPFDPEEWGNFVSDVRALIRDGDYDHALVDAQLQDIVSILPSELGNQVLYLFPIIDKSVEHAVDIASGKGGFSRKQARNAWGDLHDHEAFTKQLLGILRPAASVFTAMPQTKEFDDVFRLIKYHGRLNKCWQELEDWLLTTAQLEKQEATKV